MANILLSLAFFLITISMNCYSQCPPCSNQTSNLSLPLSEDSLPYQIVVKQADFSLPAGLQSFAFAAYKGEWLFIAGRTNGLHNVNSTTALPNSFPVKNQNTVVYIVNPKKNKCYSRSLYDPSSCLTQEQIDILSVTNSFYSQANKGKTLYLVGGYGINTATGAMESKQALTAIDVPKLIAWVKKKPHPKSAEECFRFAFDPILQLTGGKMLKGDKDGTYLLAFGQNFTGYYTTTSNGNYSMQIRRIEILDNGHDLFVKSCEQPDPLPTYRRRDLNVVPVIKKCRKSYKMSYVALSGVFTPGDLDNPGAWTVPIEISANGSSHMLDSNDPNTLAQAMNNYDCANVGLYSKKKDSMYTLLFGGISASIFSDGDCENSCVALIPNEGNVFTICCNLPFTNDITTIELDKKGVYRQYLMNTKFPTIPVPNPASLYCSDDPFPPDAPRNYYFGAEALFIPNRKLLAYPNNVIAFDHLGQHRTFLGYIVGGIASTILDTNCVTDTIASPYIFKVYIYPKCGSENDR
jgi:hypothetical protein